MNNRNRIKEAIINNTFSQEELGKMKKNSLFDANKKSKELLNDGRIDRSIILSEINQFCDEFDHEMTMSELNLIAFTIQIIERRYNIGS